MEEENCIRPRAIFMAFGTKGDVQPIAAWLNTLLHKNFLKTKDKDVLTAAVVAEFIIPDSTVRAKYRIASIHSGKAIATGFACDQKNYHVVLVTHLAHQSLSRHLSAKNVSYMSVSTPPVLPAHQSDVVSDSEYQSFTLCKRNIQKEHRQECLSVIGKILGDGPCLERDFIVINFFALEGWSLAELFQIRCIVAAPYVVPYSAPSSFERQFKNELPLLYKYFQNAPANKVCWKDVIHWMWPLFTEDWGSWRSDCLNLSSYPFTDPVTNLPMWHLRAQSPLLLYGFSKEIVECPDYWPSNIHVCGFWFLPVEWQFSCSKCKEKLSLNSPEDMAQKNELCANHTGLQYFMTKTSNPCPLIFVGLSSIGSMGFLRNSHAFLLVLKAVLEMTNYRFILFSAGYQPLDVAIQSLAGSSLNSDKLQHFTSSEDGTLLFGERLFCYSGTIPYSWLFPRCAIAIHHGGSGSTAAALHAGIPQIVCPFILDQFYWAERLCWLGVAPEPLQKQYLVPENDDATCIVQAADVLFKAIKLALSPEIKAQASKIAERLSSEDGIEEALTIFKEEVVSPIKTKGLDL